jgi:type I restriction enzyme R subunit
MNEADTRAELIDPQLKAAGWGEVEGSRIRREYPIKDGEIKPGGKREGTLSADYVLVYKNRILAAVEAKSNELDVGEGVGQAKNYAKKLRLASTYAANGKKIYEINMNTGKEGDVSQFPSPDELWNKTFTERNEWHDKFDVVPIETFGTDEYVRYYIEIAINKAMEAIADNKKRILLTLATGTGKTRIASQIAWKLFKSRWNLQKDGRRAPRILFLADRNILANQAYLGFDSFTEDSRLRIKPGEIKKRDSVPTNASVFFTIFQTFASGAKDKPYYKEYERDFFDLIVIDECHRGGAKDESSWREILEYFEPAVQIGLTATPKREDNADTYEYFGEPVYIYSLKEGIQDGFLTPFKVKTIKSSMDEYVYEPDDDVEEGELEVGKTYELKDWNITIEIEARERRLVQEMLSNINPNEKTIVFCANQAHAAFIRNLINQESSSPIVDYCVRVTANDGAIGETHLRNFQDNEKEIPTILTTSQKLSTGVDARNIRNIVLMRIVNSMIEFKQIIGRGTRLWEGKDYFTVIDFVGAYHKFNEPEWDGDPVDPVPGGSGGNGSGEEERECVECGEMSCICEKPFAIKKVKIKLADGKEREIKTTSVSMFMVDGKPLGIEEFIKKLFNTLQLPELFGSEDKLRELWANPITRRELLKKLEQHNCSKADLLKLQEIIDAKDCDLFDVLEYISYARNPITRMERVSEAEDNIYAFLNAEQKVFIEFVLSNYIKDGVDELDDSKLGELITLKYKTNTDAERALGDLREIRNIFINFQKYLYLENAS